MFKMVKSQRDKVEDVSVDLLYLVQGLDTYLTKLKITFNLISKLKVLSSSCTLLSLFAHFNCLSYADCAKSPLKFLFQSGSFFAGRKKSGF